MSIVKRHLAESEERMVLVEEICIDTGALVLDPDTTEMYFSAMMMPIKMLTCRCFRHGRKARLRALRNKYSRPQNPSLRIRCRGWVDWWGPFSR